MKVIQFPKKNQQPNKPQVQLDEQQVEKLIAAIYDTYKHIDLLHRRMSTLTKVVEKLAYKLKEQGD